MANFHLVILKKYYLDKILDGSKQIEMRLTRYAGPPFNSVCSGDTLFLKESSGPVCAVAQVSAVEQVINLNPAKIAQLKAQYNHLILGSDEFWTLKSDCKFAVLCRLKNVRTISPIRIYKKDWRAWVVLKEPNDFGLIGRLAFSGDIIKQAD